ncbi:MAG: enoyl-CoA hydratase/isomerase family protein [Ilumatobacteraceae bacterium]
MQAFTFEQRGHVRVVTLRHPTSPMNAVDELLHHEFAELFSELRRDPGGRAVVLTAEGRAFSAGGDFGWFPALRDTAVLDGLRRTAKQMIWDLLDIEVPVVCGLNGAAAGLGASIALLCDIVVMAERAVVLDPHVNVGLVAGDGGAVIWPALLGPQTAKRHLFLGEPLRADDALRLGVASEVCPAEDVRDHAIAWAERLAAQPPLALKGTKLAVNAQLKQALLTSFDLSTALEIPCFLSRDHAEAIDALREGRTPTFEGR